MAPKQHSCDPAWRHAHRLENRFHWQCLYCDMIGRGGGATRIKQHLAGGYPDVSRCSQVPDGIRRAMKQELNEKKELKYKRQQQQENFDRRASETPVYDEFEGRGEDVNEEEFSAALSASRTQYAYDEHMRYGGKIIGASGSGSFGASGSGSTGAATLERTTSARIASTKTGIGRFFPSASRRRAVDIADVDPFAFSDQASKQTRIDDAYTKEKKKSIGQSIAKFFHFNRIPSNVANSTYYRSMVSNIQKCGPGIQPPTAHEIAGPYLDEQVEEIKTWILSCKKQWNLYGVTLMCDGWTGPTRMSIINFLLYCNRKVIFHKSVDATAEYHDASYIYHLMDSVVQEIGVEHIIQVITDNGANFKRAGELLEQEYQTLFWTPCAAHCIDLMMADIGKLDTVKKVVKKGQLLTKFIYNHHWVHGLMRRFIDGEILRPGATRFATHFILLKSLFQKKNGLKTMFTSEDWETSRYSSTIEGKEAHKIIISTRFWDHIAEILTAIEPLYVVLRKVDMDKKPQMGNIYHLIHEAKEEIKRRLQSSTKYQHYIDIITSRWDNQMGKYIHLAGYYLNPAYQYRYNLATNDNLLVALKNVILRLQPNRELAAEAINESRLFREGYGSFADPFAISCRYKMDAAEWWLQYGGSAPNLKKIAVRILSQTTSSSGCERNWSTFSLIHTKAMVGNHQEFVAVLKRLRGKNSDVSQEAEEIMEFTVSLQQLPQSSMVDLFQKRYLHAVTVGVGLMILQQFGGVNAICFYASEIFVSAGFSSGNTGMIAMAAVQIPMTTLGVILMDRSGRRPLLMVSAAGTCVGCFLVAIVFLLKDHDFPKDVTTVLALGGILIYTGSFSLGMGAIPWVIMSEIFPLNMKGTAGSLVTFVSWAGSWVISFGFNFLMMWNSAGTFFIFASICGLTVVFVERLVPETKGRTLEEIQASMSFVSSD